MIFKPDKTEGIASNPSTNNYQKTQNEDVLVTISDDGNCLHVSVPKFRNGWLFNREIEFIYISSILEDGISKRGNPYQFYVIEGWLEGEKTTINLLYREVIDFEVGSRYKINLEEEVLKI